MRTFELWVQVVPCGCKFSTCTCLQQDEILLPQRDTRQHDEIVLPQRTPSHTAQEPRGPQSSVFTKNTASCCFFLETSGFWCSAWHPAMQSSGVAFTPYAGRPCPAVTTPSTLELTVSNAESEPRSTREGQVSTIGCSP